VRPGQGESATQELRRRLEFAEGLLRGCSEGLFAVDGDYRLLHWSPVMEKIFGLAAGEVLDRVALDVLPFLRRNGDNERIRRSFLGDTVVATDRPYVVAATGREGSYEARYTPLRLDSGEIVGAAGVVREMTAQKVAEGLLRETESRFKNMADAAPVLLWMSGTDSLCTFFNQSWLDFTGRTLEQEWGVGWAEGVHPEDFQRCMDEYVAAFSARRVLEIEYRLRRADGEYRWILDRGTPRYTPDGAFAGFIGSCIDITDRKILEGQLRKAVRDRDDFLSIASHELRTPLTSLQLQLESLMRTVEDRPEEGLASGRLQKRAQAACAQSHRLANLVEELLDVSRIANGKLRLTPSQVELATVVADVTDRLAGSIAAAQCMLETYVEPGVAGWWDRARIEQVITNLLSNAIKYAPGKPIAIRGHSEGGLAVVAVSDEGIGIASVDQARIFDRFERAVPTRNYGGFGLGLWIAREILDAHGGSIAVESEPGKGATFTVRLPLERSRHDIDRPAETLG
jgi:PAS domain S-box-containing protein